MSSIYNYFKRSDGVKTDHKTEIDPTLPSPDGPLSRIVPSSTIETMNKKVAEVKQDEPVVSTGRKRKRGGYEKHTVAEKAKIAMYAVYNSCY